jgi:hypothetical protein
MRDRSKNCRLDFDTAKTIDKDSSRIIVRLQEISTSLRPRSTPDIDVRLRQCFASYVNPRTAENHNEIKFLQSSLYSSINKATYLSNVE